MLTTDVPIELFHYLPDAWAVNDMSQLSSLYSLDSVYGDPVVGRLAGADRMLRHARRSRRLPCTSSQSATQSAMVTMRSI
jgi:hypothetical protein